MHRQRIFSILFLLFSLILPASPFGFAEEPEKTESEQQQEVTEPDEMPNPYFERLVPPDRTAMRRFEQAKRLIEAERLAEAAQLLGAILEGPIDFFIAPSFEGEAAENAAARTSERLFGDLVLETLQGLPSKARESYILQYDAQARRLLENAVRDGSIEGVQYVARRYFPTRAGAAATFLLGVDQMDRGACESAALSFGRLNESRTDLTEFEPALSLSLATCQLRLGRTGEARKTIDSFRKRTPEPEILLFGKDPWKPASTDEIVTKLETLHESSAPVSMAAWLERIGWLSNAGSPNQNAETEAEKPLLELLWSVPTLNKPAHQREVQSMMSAARRERGVQIPAARPLVLGDRLLMRGVGELMAVDARTGKLLWSAAEPEYRIAKSLQGAFRTTQHPIRIGGPEGGLSLRLHFWFDHISHQLSSDGRQLFSIDGHDLRDISFAALGPGRNNIRIGRKATEDPRVGPGNTLTARDVETGRILWQAGKFPYVQKFLDRFVEEFEQEEARKKAGAEAAKDGKNPNTPPERPDRDFTEEERFLGETWFLGAPQVHEGRLHVIGENGGQLRLIILDADNGRLIRQVPIAVPPSTFESDPVRKFFGLTPSISDGILVCPTALGMVVALDATTATPLWCFSYLTPPKEGTEVRNRRNMRNFPFRMGGFDDARNHFTESGWQMPSIQIDGNRILVAPPDDPSLSCLDSASGRLLWKNADFKRETALYVACIRRDTAYVVMPDGIAAFDMETGRTVWEPVANDPKAEKDAAKEDAVRLAFPAPLKPAGVGIRNGNLYYLPFPDGILGLVDLDRAEMELMASGPLVRKRRIETDTPNPIGGHWIRVDGAVTEDEIPAFTPAWTPPYPDSDAANREILLGNLVGIHGRFFSHTPLQVACFDQWAPLQRRAETLLEADPKSPEGLLQLGRIRRAEKNLPEAVDLFRRAMIGSAGGGADEYARDCLRGTLRDAVGNDYNAWKQHGDELERLAEFPEELGESLYLLARGALRHGDFDTFFDVLRKAFRLEIDHSILVAVDSEHCVQLHRALGLFVQDQLRRPSDSPLRTELDRVAETLFRGLAEKKDIGDFLPRLHLNDAELTKHHFLMRPWWEEEATALSSEARRWQVFRELFQKMPIAEQAGNALDEYYVRNRLYTALELKINPPVDWGFSEKLFEVPAPAAPDESVALQPMLPIAPPQLPEKKIDAGDLERLAKYLLAGDNPADALYYRRLLEKRSDAESSSIPPEIQKRLDREQAAAVWPSGRVSVEDEPQTKNEPAPQDPRGAAIASILRSTLHPGRFQTNRRSLSFFGSYEPFLSPYTYCLETEGSDVHLLCCDELGEERWKSRVSDIAANMSEYGFFSENNIYSILGSMDQTVYLKGCNHLLVFVRDNELIVFDTFRIDPNEGPRVLWTKTLPVKLPNRLMYSAIPLSNLQAYSMQPNRGFPRESLFVGPQVICYRDTERIYGLDPYSGQILWSREALSPHGSILGDRENLFLVYPDIHQAVAVDPANGRELASGTIPAGGLFAFETNIVFVKQASLLNSPNHNRPYQILVGDLRELYQKRRRALLVSDESVQGGIPSIPTWPIREDLTHEAMLRQVHHGRFLASVSWTSKTLQMYDLQNKTGVLGPLGDLGRRTGVKLPDPLLRDSRRRHDSDFDVEILDDKLLVYFIEKGDVDRQMKSVVDERGVPVRQRRDAVNNLPARNFGTGSMMLYRSDGTACWTKPVRLEDWYRVLRVPDGLPVALFAVSMTEQENRNGPNQLFTGLCGIDKRTGETRFRCWVPPLPQNRNQTLLQGFHVQADPWKKEIAFVTPHRTVLAKFTDQKPEPPKPVEQPQPQKNVLDRMFNMFGE